MAKVCKTVAIKLNDNFFVGNYNPDKKEITSFEKLDKFNEIEMKNSSVYIILLEADEESKKNNIFALEEVPVKDENNNPVFLDKVSSEPDFQIMTLCNRVLKRFNSNVTYH